jgi:CspA family cold shock protein
MDDKHTGTVVWFSNSRGIGFIARDDEKDIFVHWSDIVSEGYKTLKKGQKVTFTIGLNNRKEIKATEVTVVEEP